MFGGYAAICVVAFQIAAPDSPAGAFGRNPDREP
jgi:hypothetical protein